MQNNGDANYLSFSSPFLPSLSYIISTTCQPQSNAEQTKPQPPWSHGGTWHKANVLLKDSKLNKWQLNHTLHTPIKHDLKSWVWRIFFGETGYPLATDYFSYSYRERRGKRVTDIGHLQCTRYSAVPFSGLLLWLSHIHKIRYMVKA